MDMSSFEPTDPCDNVWDFVIVGTGAGGATAGLTLARSGSSVLFLERGTIQLSASSDSPSITHTPGTVLADCPPYGANHSGSRPFELPKLSVGAGVGGSTALYAAVLERFRPIDFTPRSGTQPPEGCSAPDTWPIGYSDLEPYYAEAETLFRVRGSQDPLAPVGSALLQPPTASTSESLVSSTLLACGMTPYCMHYARETVASCDGCVARRCEKSCRNDTRKVCVLPALTRHGAHILSECSVVKLETKGRAVVEAICLWRGRRIGIRGRTYILALNALFTPALLLHSANDTFPDGLGNASGLVGRNLMLHVSDVAFARFRTQSRGLMNNDFSQGISLNDFYSHEEGKLGNIHAHAVNFRGLGSEFSSYDDGPGTVAFSTIVEDFPYLHNRVVPRRSCELEVDWQYRYPIELHHRNELLLELFGSALEGAAQLHLRTPHGLLNPSHICGTCRFGDNPLSSVLDRNNRVHDVDNAFVLDASFFPTSGGINPSLTVMANSLRVSSFLARH